MSAKRKEIELTGVRIVFVHLGTEEQDAPVFERYQLGDIRRISDPQAKLYKLLMLNRASLLKMFNPISLFRGMQTLIQGGHRVGKPVGDIQQMSGVFLLHLDRIIYGRALKTIHERPDYLQIVKDHLQ
ncbi:AhpC/TSA family protein [Planctomycetota bacterium]